MSASFALVLEDEVVLLVAQYPFTLGQTPVLVTQPDWHSVHERPRSDSRDSAETPTV